MVAFSLIGPTIFLVSGQSFNQFILTLGLIILAVVLGLTAFIFIRIFFNWLQAKLENNRLFFRRSFTRNTGHLTADISQPGKGFFFRPD